MGTEKVKHCFCQYEVRGLLKGCSMLNHLHLRSISAKCTVPILERRVRSQMASLVAFEAATYSDSAVESATVGCFLEDQETIPPATLKTNPPIDLLESGSWAQSESVHPTRSTASPERPNVSPKCAVH